MRKRWKRWLAGLMTAVMLMGTLPTAAYAAVGDLLNMSAVQRTALLEALEEVYGDDAEAYLAVLEQYGLIDEDGNFVTDEKIIMDGQEYTLEEIEAILDDPATDLSKVVEVDGTYLTLADLKTVVEIEQYLAYLKATYFTKQDLSREQVASFYDLADAWANGDIQMLAANTLSGVGPAGVDHDVRLDVEADATASENGTYTVTVTPTRAQTKDITFSWRALSGSVGASGSGTETIPAGSIDPVTLTVDVGEVQGRTQGDATFLVQIYNVKNALIGGKSRWEQNVTVQKQDVFKYQGEKTETLSPLNERHYYYSETRSSGLGSELIAKYNNKEWMESAQTISVKVPDLSPGTYSGTATFDVTFTREDYEDSAGKSYWYDPPLKGTAWADTIDWNGRESWRFGIDDAYSEEYRLGTFRTDYIGSGINEDNKTLSAAETTVVSGDQDTTYKITIQNKVSGYGWEDSDHEQGYFFYFLPRTSGTVTLKLQESTKNANVTFSAPAGVYYSGQSVPITAVFDYPVEITEGMTIAVNGGGALSPEEIGTTGETCTFLYPVDNTSGGSLTITETSFVGDGNADVVEGANGLGMTVQVAADSPIQIGMEASGVKLESIDRADAFAAYHVGVTADEETKQPQLVVTVSLSGNSKATAWVLSELNGTTLNALQVMTSQTGTEKYPFTVNNTQNPTALTATIPLPYNTSESDLTGQVDFLLDGAVLMGKGLEYTVSGSVLVAADDMKPVLTVTPAGGEAAEYKPGEEVPQLYAQQDNALTLSFELARDKDYTWGDKDKVTYYKEDGTLVDETAHFAWKSSDPKVAAVSVQDGGTVIITPTGQGGTVELTLTALNGAMSDVESAPIAITFAVGQDPFLMIPQSGKTVSIREGQDAVVNWSSNLCQKNETAGEGGTFVPTEFKVYLYSSSGEKLSPEAVWTTTLTTTAENKTISSVTVPWTGALENIYNGGIRSATVVITAEYEGKTYGDTDANAVIKMTSQPASVVLAEPEGGLYQTDGGTGKGITLNWTLEHLDSVTGGQFELYVASTNKGFGTDGILSVTGADLGNTGTYTLNVPAVELTDDPTSYRDSYTITVKAKNAAESTWAYSSYVLYVYSDIALQLLLDGADAGGSHTMSNVDRITKLWGQGGEAGSEAIVALQRDIALKSVISINYGEYAWAELADQIAWNSSKSDVASVNYQQGTLYENIENFSYTSYRPATDFILSGLKDGETTITATHVKTGIEDSVTVNVETLRDKLYLFQCYPKAKTTLTYEVYTDAEHTQTEQMTLDTNENGEAAIYAPYGIAGDVYCKSETTEDGETVTYLGTIYNRSLVSSEADSTKLQLYPVNTLQLRRAAQAEIYLKNPDGTPYANKQVTFRGGVYRNGEYCLLDNVEFGLQDNARKDWKIGSEKQTVETDENGRLLVTMDLMQFKTSADQEPVQAGEKLYYIFQLDYGNGNDASHYPLFLRVDANLNLDDIAATGDSIVAWEKNESGQKGPYVAQQTLKYSASASANVADVRKSTGSVGPSTTFPNAWLTTTVMWWGDAEANAEGRANTVTIQDTTGRALGGQTSKATTYPFTDVAFTENVLKLDESVMKSWGLDKGQKRTVQAALSKDGTATDRTIALPFQLVNMVGVEQAEDSSVLTDSLEDIKSNLNVDAGGSVGNMGVNDTLLQSGMKLLAGDAQYDPDANRDAFMVQLYATSDPTVFRALFCLSGGNMSSGHNVTGVYPEYNDIENMSYVTTQNSSDVGKYPNPFNVYDMVRGNYLDKVKAEANQAAAGKAVRGISMDLGGYFEADIAYNSERGQWECKPISGGFHVGGGLNYTWNVNAIVGIVPVTASLTLGGTVEIRMDMQQGNYYDVSSGMDALKSAHTEEDFDAALAAADYTAATANDYLTSLRLFFYARAFAGVGFDISVVAFKIGVFGQLDLDLQFKWLNRNYLDDSGNISAVGPLSSRQDEVMFGSDAAISGSTGIEFVFKFLFISYEKILCSIGFKVGQSVEDWETIEEIWAANKTINNEPVTRTVLPNGQVMYAVDMGAQMESRDYVDAAEQQWMGGRPSIGLFSMDEDQDATLANPLQSGAYSYANPVVSDDGKIMFYLSDRGEGKYADAKDITNTRAAVSAKQGNQFQEGRRFDDTLSGETPVGYGDSNVKLAGTRASGYAAVWVRQTENIVPENAANGGALTEGEQMLQMNSTEIIAATSEDGNNWTLTQLTDNSTPDLAPVVAISEDRTVVAWREVSSTGKANDNGDAMITNFDQQDAIRYKVYENGEWGEIQTLYDGTGTSASVKGLEATMLSDGTTAVVYTLDTNSSNNSNTDWETVMAVIPAGGMETFDGEEAESQDTVRTFQLTSDSDLDENPQITAVRFDDGTERFVAAWHTERAITDTADGETESDIRLAAMDKNGVRYENMPESLGRATEGTGETVGSNFRFAKNADTMEDLSILWVDSVSPEDAGNKTYENEKEAIQDRYSAVGHDVLKAVKFVPNDSSYTISGTVEVAKMEEGTLIDHFDAYMESGKVKSVILGTNYDQTTGKEVEISDGETTETAIMTVANPVTGMYTATAEFTNRVEMSAVMLEYEKLYPNSDIDVQFTIRNSGKEPITKLEILSGNEAVYTSGDTALNLLPNRDITVTAKFPTGDAIKDTDYTIQATFAGGKTAELNDTLYLDIPDVGVSKVEPVQETGGERTLRYSLYNELSAKLADTDDGWRVQVGFYADKDCTEPLTDAKGEELVRTIDEKEDLALIDAGGYSAEVTLPVAKYMTADGVQAEIPASGIPVYIKAWVEAPVKDETMKARIGSEYDSVNEYISGNNTTSLTLDNLAVRQGEDVTIQQTLDNSGAGSKVNVSVQYNKLTGTTSGNLIVTLLDENGNPIARKQSYSENNDLLQLSREGTVEKTFTFDQKGASVRVEFSNVILEGDSVELSRVTVAGYPATYDPKTKTYTVDAMGLTSGAVDLYPESPKQAVITLNDSAYDHTKAPTPMPLSYGTTTWAITVTNGGNTEAFTLVLNNADPSPSSGGGNSGGGGGGGSSSSVSHTITVPEDTEHGTVTVSPEKAKSGQTVTITAKPDEGYQVGKVTVTKSNGDTVRVTDKGNGVYTFTMPGSKVSVDVTFAPEGQWTNPFVDVAEDAWYYDAVKYVNENGLMAGTSANTFAPDRTTTRGMIVTILYRLEGSPDIENEIWGYPFKDVDANAYYATAVYWARMNGIVAGYSDELFGPDDIITREQMATILYRYAQYKGYDTTAKADLSRYTDAAQVGSYAVDAIRWANAEGLVNGTSATTLTPKGSATRAQVAVILTRFCQNIAK